MAQKREIEEAEFHVPENRPLCKTPIPTPHTDLDDDDDDDEQKKPNASRFTNISDPKLSGSASLGSSSVNMSPDRSDTIHPSPTEEKAKEDMMKRRREVNRCSGCRRKVGLIGFRCRCGDLFCSEHRYSDRHDCNFDYKAAGREAIARENPVVRPAKILKV